MSTSLLRRRMMAKNQEKRTYLYHEGDTCDEITGGWEVITNANLEDDHIFLMHNHLDKKIKTVNQVLFKKLYVDVERVGNTNNIYNFKISTNKNTKQFHLVTGERVILESGFNDIITSEITFGSYFGTYKIYNVWIE